MVHDATLPHDAVLRPEHCQLVVEVVSPGPTAIDRLHKPAEYAAAGIAHHWWIEDVDGDKKTMTVFRFHLDPTTHVYVPTGIDTGVLSVREPVDLTIRLADLYRGRPVEVKLRRGPRSAAGASRVRPA